MLNLFPDHPVRAKTRKAEKSKGEKSQNVWAWILLSSPRQMAFMWLSDPLCLIISIGGTGTCPGYLPNAPENQESVVTNTLETLKRSKKYKTLSL